MLSSQSILLLLFSETCGFARKMYLKVTDLEAVYGK